MSRADWLRYRMTGIGASEVGTVMKLNPYKSAIQLFYEKIGDYVESLENLAMFLGTESEEFIADLWQYWPEKEGSTQAMIENYRAGRVIRRCQRVNAYVRNPKYPWLFVSLDRKINKTAIKGEGALELKRISSWEADKWEAGIVPGHVVQVQTQIMVAEFDHGEMAVLQDGPEYNVFPFTLNKAICKAIVKDTKEFWDRVLEARIVQTRKFEATRTFNMRMVQDCDAALQKLEPEPDGTQAYADFLKKKYRIDDPGEKAGTDEVFQWACSLVKCNEKMKRIAEDKLLYENRIKKAMGDKVTKFTFGDKGYVGWGQDVNGTRRFVNKLKM